MLPRCRGIRGRSFLRDAQARDACGNWPPALRVLPHVPSLPLGRYMRHRLITRRTSFGRPTLRPHSSAHSLDPRRGGQEAASDRRDRTGPCVIDLGLTAHATLDMRYMRRGSPCTKCGTPSRRCHALSQPPRRRTAPHRSPFHQIHYLSSAGTCTQRFRGP